MKCIILFLLLSTNLFALHEIGRGYQKRSIAYSNIYPTKFDNGMRYNREPASFLVDGELLSMYNTSLLGVTKGIESILLTELNKGIVKEQRVAINPEYNTTNRIDMVVHTNGTLSDIKVHGKLIKNHNKVIEILEYTNIGRSDSLFKVSIPIEREVVIKKRKRANRRRYNKLTDTFDKKHKRNRYASQKELHICDDCMLYIEQRTDRSNNTMFQNIVGDEPQFKSNFKNYTVRGKVKLISEIADTIKNRDEVKQTIEKRLGGVKFLYHKFLQQEKFNGVLKIKLVILASGAVSRATCLNGVSKNHQFEKKVIKRVKRWKFPRTIKEKRTIYVSLKLEMMER